MSKKVIPLSPALEEKISDEFAAFSRAKTECFRDFHHALYTLTHHIVKSVSQSSRLDLDALDEINEYIDAALSRAADQFESDVVRTIDRELDRVYSDKDIPEDCLSSEKFDRRARSCAYDFLEQKAFTRVYFAAVFHESCDEIRAKRAEELRQ